MLKLYSGLIKIIHIVENLDKGAVENWLIRVFLESRKLRPDWQWTFYCILGKEGRLDEIVKAAGGKIIYSPYWISDKLLFLKALRKTLKSDRYDIIHSHHDYLSGFYLFATAGIKFKKRILQVHNTDKILPVGSERLQKSLLPIFKKSAVYFSNLIIGISKNTLLEFAGSLSNNKKKYRVLYYGIDLTPFDIIATSNNLFYKEMNIPVNARVLLFIGRLNVLKNPVFVVEILAALSKKRKDVYAIFVGNGDEATILNKAIELGLKDKIRLAGWRNDTVALMKAADIFVFPRAEYPKEGLGLVVVEAQAAGLPMLLSKGIVEDAIEIPALAHVLPLNNNPEEWAVEADKILNTDSIDRGQAYLEMKKSKFEMKRATENFINLYEE